MRIDHGKYRISIEYGYVLVLVIYVYFTALINRPPTYCAFCVVKCLSTFLITDGQRTSTLRRPRRS